jgi:shikimate 5-dehydrogenase
MFSQIIGSNVFGNAKSPGIWNKLYKNLNIDCEMMAVNKEKHELKNFLKEIIFAHSELKALLIAAPYKEYMAQLASTMGCQGAENLESINLIYRKGLDFHATSTDGFGAIKSLDLDSKPKTFLILGFGGTSKSIINAVQDQINGSTIYVATRNKNPKLNVNEGVNFIEYNEISSKISNVDILINATVFGNKEFPNESPISSLPNHGNDLLALDVNYNDSGTTSFVNICRGYGYNAKDGSEMNLLQAVYAFSLCHDTKGLTIKELSTIALGN